MEWLGPYLPALMFASLAIFLFSGFPVAFVLGGIGLGFGFIAYWIDPWLFDLAQFGALPSRIFGAIAENLILTAIPMFIFMGTMLEKSGVARDLLNCLQVLLRRVPGGLALAVTLMGTILAATTGIIGASVVMMSLLALPVMIQRGYAQTLSTGTIAASGTLGILIPPSIMLVIMADLLSRSVGNLFVAAVIPGFMLSFMYVIYIVVVSMLKPQLAPKLPPELGPRSAGAYVLMLARSFLPPVFLIFCVLGSILGGFATPTEAAGVGAIGSVILAFINLVLLPALKIPEFHFEGEAKADLDDHATGQGSGADLAHFWGVLKDVVVRTGLTNAMLFGIFVGATLFSYMFRALGGEAQVDNFIEHLGLGPWGLLFMLMAIVFVLGFFLDWIEITLIVLPVFAPVVAGLDFGDHVMRSEVTYWFAILLAVNLQTSFLTPPFGFALFYMKAVAPPEIKIQKIYLGIIPFVLIQLLALALVVLFPELALWLPRQVFG
ncbi:TRAP transporter large permease [Oricola indica]|jgi:TRAP-type mannitol/chloroaromatic compound transport system permease large subunit|uniref:TRAP transporter large permease n=1 Tax=Oricola indica TaxID=2872591 RepID=UPI001CBE5F32|nr:TRAP transporter large permease subunit [Oricola indica]